MRYYEGKEYPWLCSSCQKLIDSLAMVVEEGEVGHARPTDTDDEEAPCTMAYDQALFCDGRRCWDHEYEKWKIRDIRSLYQVLLDAQEGESTYPNENPPTTLILKIVREILKRDPFYDIERAQKLANSLWQEFALRVVIGRCKASLPHLLVQRQAA